MSTSWDIPFEVFFKKIEKDADFFSYNNVTLEDALEIARERAKGYLKEAVVKLTLNCTPDIDFLDYDEEAEIFNPDLTVIEVDILASLMREKYFDKDASLLKAFQTRFSPKDLTVFSPANERRTFMDMVKDITSENIIAISQYAAKDRITGKLKMINFSSYYNE